MFFLDTLDVVLDSRFELFSTLDNFDLAIALLDEASTGQTNSSIRSLCLSNLGIRLRSRCERTWCIADLERAITADEEAVSLTRIDNIVSNSYLTSLANALRARFDLSNETRDLEWAITLFAAIVVITYLHY